MPPGRTPGLAGVRKGQNVRKNQTRSSSTSQQAGLEFSNRIGQILESQARPTIDSDDELDDVSEHESELETDTIAVSRMDAVPEAKGTEEIPKYLQIFMNNMMKTNENLSNAVNKFSSELSGFKNTIEKIYATMDILTKNVATLQEEAANTRIFRDEMDKKFTALQDRILHPGTEHSIHSQPNATPDGRLLEKINRLAEKVILLEKKPDQHQSLSFAAALNSGQNITPNADTSLNIPQANNNNLKTQGKPLVKQPKILQATYPRAVREVMVRLKNASSIAIDQNTEDQALEIVNTALAKSFIGRRLFHGARFSLARNLILTMGLQDCNTDFVGCLSIIEEALQYLGQASASLRVPWTKYLLHGVPSQMELETIRRDVEAYCPGAKLGQTPRWLSTEDSRKEKNASTIVLAFQGVITFADLGGRVIRVGNRSCNLSSFIEFNEKTQCTNCQLFGHPKELCSAGPTCAVCAEAHSTDKHTCTLDPEKCKCGYRCNHNIKCTNCGAPHRASNRNCPEKVKRSAEFREALKERHAARIDLD